jgi:uncharacterized protein GlcG (DUF336 family)/Rieske Fe-S protein
VLTHDQALSLLEAAREESGSVGVPMSFAVMDPGGHLVALVRMDGAPWISTDVAQGKAWTAAAYGMPSAGQKAKMDALPNFSTALATMTGGRFTPQHGAVPVYAEGSLVGALGAMGIPLIVSFADLGPWPTKKRRAATIETTIWAPGIRLVNDITYVPIKASDLEIGQLVNGQPENLKDLEGTEFLQAKAKSSIIVVRMDPNTIRIPASRQDWQVGGILCYSKICTHVGCPISLWEQQTHHLLCPCHQSTFDLGNSGLVVFGPAARALPQLPITVDAEGYLVARDGFPVPVGPSYFERDSRSDFKGE